MAESFPFNSFSPFEHIAGIKPGVDRLNHAVDVLGYPENVEFQTPDNKTKGYMVLSYPSKGLFYLIEFGGDEGDNPIIDGIWMEPPFKGSSSCGLRLGMPEGEMRSLLKENYHIESDYNGFLFAAAASGKSDVLQVWYDSDGVSRFKIFRESQ